MLRALAASILVLAGCAATTGRPVPPSAQRCAAPTPATVLDAFMADLATAAASNTAPGRSFDARLVRRQFAELRARIAAGTAVLDPRNAEECVRHTRVMSEHETFDAPGEPCARAARPRCAAPVGTPCAIDGECDAALFCDGALPSLYGGEPCLARGHCAPRIPIGGVCVPDASHACAAPEAGGGWTICGPDLGDAAQGRCGVVTLTPLDAGPCGTITVRDGAFDITICEPPLVCASNACRALAHDVAVGGPCDFDTECAASARCDSYARRCIALEAPCEGRRRCPTGHACAAGRCTPSDGTRGAPCEPGSCVAGLACRDGVCGDAFAVGEQPEDELECASQCAETTAESGTRRCVPRG